MHSERGGTVNSSRSDHQGGGGSGGSRPMVKAASTQARSPWSSDARAWLAPRPTRSTSTITLAGPGSGAQRKWAVAASGSRCGLSATSSASPTARAMAARR